MKEKRSFLLCNIKRFRFLKINNPNIILTRPKVKILRTKQTKIYFYKGLLP
jgi:hypothetical protein